MIEFWLGAALLLLFTAALLWFPAFRSARMQRAGASAQELELQVYQSRVNELTSERESGAIDDARYEQLRAELDRNFLAAQQQGDSEPNNDADPRPSSGLLGFNALAIILTIVILPGVIALYFNLGSSQVLREMGFQAELAQQLAELAPNERITLLEKELQGRSDNPDLHYLAAREYMGVKNYPKAIAAYDKLVHLSQGHPDLLAEYAQASFYMEGNKVGARSRELARLAVAKQPDNSTALGLLGIDAFENKRYAEAISYWQSILDAHPNIGEADSLRIGIARARAMAGETAATRQDASEQMTEGPQLVVSVSLAPELKSVANPDDTLFVFARAISGPPMPLAALRLKAGDLPQQVILSDAQAMTPAAKLSTAEEVMLLARISKSGTPQSQSGDLEGEIGPIKVNSAQSKIQLLIDKVVE